MQFFNPNFINAGVASFGCLLFLIGLAIILVGGLLALFL